MRSGTLLLVAMTATFYIVFLVAFWRGMKAHEAIAQTLAEALKELRRIHA